MLEKRHHLQKWYLAARTEKIEEWLLKYTLEWKSDTFLFAFQVAKPNSVVQDISLFLLLLQGSTTENTAHYSCLQSLQVIS